MHEPQNNNDFDGFKIVKKELSQVRQLITAQLETQNESLKQVMQFLNPCSGKMLRPALILLAAKSCNKINDQHILAAAIIEMIHNATLLHDDVIDDGKQRRSMPTVNYLKGNEFAVLLGDFLLTRVFTMCIALDRDAFKIVADITAQTCRGELTKLIERANWQLTEQEYIEIITRKSAALFQGCCKLGAALASAPENQTKALADFGLNFGITFQITDDMLDIAGHEAKTGKTLGRDVDKNKLTLPIINLLQIVSPEDKTKLLELLTTADQKSYQQINQMITIHNCMKYTEQKAADFVNNAINALTPIPDSPAKSKLKQTAKALIKRSS